MRELTEDDAIWKNVCLSQGMKDIPGSIVRSYKLYYRELRILNQRWREVWLFLFLASIIRSSCADLFIAYRLNLRWNF